MTQAHPGTPVRSPSIFVSYSHDSQEHKDRVLALANRFRADGVDCVLDQYEEAPPEGWPVWMMRHLRQADFVLVVCTPTYCRRVIGEEPPGRGAGAKWEGSLITQAIYEAEGANRKYVPVLFPPDDTSAIPIFLRGTTNYHLADEVGYARLYRRLTWQPEIIKPPLGQPRIMPPKAHGAAERGTDQDATDAVSRSPSPGAVPPRSGSAEIPMPRIPKVFTDKDRDKFLSDAFDHVETYFREALVQLAKTNPGVDVDLQNIHGTKFTAVAYVGGNVGNRCKIWIGGLLSQNSIYYAEGRSVPVDDDTTSNDRLSVEDDERALRLKALLASSFPTGPQAPKTMDAEQAAEYLWRRFTKPLGG